MRQGGTLRQRGSTGSNSHRRDELAILGEAPEPRIALSRAASERGMTSRLLLSCHSPVSALRSAKWAEPLVSGSEFRELQLQVKELQRLLSKKLLENEILKEAMNAARKRSVRSTRRYRC
jgi:transposase